MNKTPKKKICLEHAIICRCKPHIEKNARNSKQNNKQKQPQRYSELNFATMSEDSGIR